MIEEPVIVFPLTYEIPLNMWRWCRCDEVFRAAQDIARFVGGKTVATPEELIWKFAALSHRNKLPCTELVRTCSGEEELLGKKMFRYSLDGKALRAKQVGDRVPYDEFIIEDYQPSMFVAEGWARDTLRAIRRGAHAALNWGEHLVGQTDLELPQGGSMISLGGKKPPGMLAGRAP